MKELRSSANRLRLNIISFYRKVKLRLTCDPRSVSHLEKDLSVQHSWYGNSYGGFYAIPKLLNTNSVVYSFGIGKDISFDTKIMRKHGCEVHGFDPTPSSIEWIGSLKHSKRFKFHDFGISESTGTMEFHVPVDRRYVSGSMVADVPEVQTRTIAVQMKTLADVAAQLGHVHIDLLKMDIEGAEYDVIPSLLDSSVTFDQLLVEFHDRMFASEDQEPRSKAVVELLKAKGYRIFAHSLSFEEVSFIHERNLPQLQG